MGELFKAQKNRLPAFFFLNKFTFILLDSEKKHLAVLFFLISSEFFYFILTVTHWPLPYCTFTVLTEAVLFHSDNMYTDEFKMTK